MSSHVRTGFCLVLLSAVVPVAGSDRAELIVLAREAHHAGEYHRAKQLLEQVHVTATQSADADPRRLETQVQLAESLLELGEYARCEQLCRDAIDSLEKQAGDKLLLVARSEALLTRMYVQLGLYKLAECHCKHGLEISKSLLDERHPDVAALQAWMRQIWNNRSRDGDARAIERLLPTLEQELGASDPRWIVVLEAVAGDCYDRWNPAHATRAVTIAEAAYGKQHPVYGRCLSTLATALRQTRAGDESERVARHAIEVLGSRLGREHPQLWKAYRNLASIELARGHSAQAEAHFRNAIRLRFSTLSDDDLCRFFAQLVESGQNDSGEEDVSELYLTEMIRRGGPVIQAFLTETIATRRRQYLKALSQPNPGDDFETWFATRPQVEHYSRNLELVTALCRIDMAPDPLRVFVAGPHELTSEFPSLPTLDVTIRNVDAQNREIGFTASGDYRSGRQARWRIEVTDSAGGVRPPRREQGPVIGGGIFQMTTLKPGEGWQTDLTMARFIESLTPGEYQVRVLYHNDLKIVDQEFTAGLIVSRSDPIKLTVQPRAITVSNQEWLARLDDRTPRKIITGTYGPWAHTFIDPRGQYGQLLTLGWSAVPTLIEELAREGQSPERRAHLLALLFSITGENDPRPSGWVHKSGALGSYAVLDQGWSISSRRAGEDAPVSWSGGLTAGPTQYDADLAAGTQAPFIERWQKFKQNLAVTIAE